MEQNISTPQQGMLSPEGYNGKVDVMGNPIDVKNGIAEYNGERYFVSNNGMLVVNSKRQVVGYVENGQFKPHDAKQLKMLQEQGLIEGAEK